MRKLPKKLWVVLGITLVTGLVSLTGVNLTPAQQASLEPIVEDIVEAVQDDGTEPRLSANVDRIEEAERSLNEGETPNQEAPETDFLEQIKQSATKSLIESIFE